MGYKLRWVNETGGDWMHDGEVYSDLDLCTITAQMAFDDEYVDVDDIVQAWEVNEDGDVIDEGTASAEWSSDSF